MIALPHIMKRLHNPGWHVAPNDTCKSAELMPRTGNVAHNADHGVLRSLICTTDTIRLDLAPSDGMLMSLLCVLPQVCILWSVSLWPVHHPH